MLAVAIIVFREVLEAALIVSIVMAASLGIAMRNQWIGAGVAGGVLGAGLVAMFAASISAAFSGAGQEILNASILLFAVAMLAWHNIWMARHGRQMAQQAKDVGRQVAAGTRPLYALSLICGFAVLRGRAPARAATIIVATLLCGARPAWADLHVRMPTVDYRELEFEHNGLFSFRPEGLRPEWSAELHKRDRVWRATLVEDRARGRVGWGARCGADLRSYNA